MSVLHSNVFRPVYGRMENPTPPFDEGELAWRVFHVPTKSGLPIAMFKPAQTIIAMEILEHLIDWETDDPQELNRRICGIGGWEYIMKIVTDEVFK